VAASLVSTSRQLGSVLGVAIVGSILAVGGSSRIAATSSGFGVPVSVVLAACGLVVVCVNALPSRHPAAQRRLHPALVLTTSQREGEPS
jgi:hypothetical protein